MNDERLAFPHRHSGSPSKSSGRIGGALRSSANGRSMLMLMTLALILGGLASELPAEDVSIPPKEAATNGAEPVATGGYPPDLAPADLGGWLLREKAALSHILLQACFAEPFLALSFLSSRQKKALHSRAEAEWRSLSKLYRTTQRLVTASELGLDADASCDLIDAGAYNVEVTRILSASQQRVEEILAPDAGQFLSWIAASWLEDRARATAYSRKGGIRSGNRLTYTVFATQYFGETNYEAALPDKYLKFANRNWSHYPGYEGSNYSVQLDRSGYTVPSVLVWDVGPWNIDDNYWNPATGHPRPRRMFTDLPQGMPEAQAAYYNGYNGGKDQYGRTVTVPTALDMTPDLAADLGLAYLQNDWITVTYLWEDQGGTEIIVDDSDAAFRLVGPLQYWWEITGYGTNNQMHYTYNMPSGYTNAAIWAFNTTESGNYQVSVFIPRNHATTTSARYFVNSGSGWKGPNTVNQNIYYDEWVSIGTHWLRKGTNGVGVIDGTGEPVGTTKVGADAVKIKKTD